MPRPHHIRPSAARLRRQVRSKPNAYRQRLRLFEHLEPRLLLTDTPWVVAQTPTGTLDHVVDQLELQFSEPVSAATFQSEDVSLNGPAGLVTPIQVVPLAMHSIRAYINGRDQLILRDNTVQWQHLELALPGQYGGHNEPTSIDGQAWLPEWSDGEFSSIYTLLSPAIPEVEQALTLVPVAVRGSATIVQQPAAANDYTTIIELNDPDSGPDWYEVQLVTPNADAARRYELTFPAQDQLGTYELTVGPQIADADGNLMDQNQNGLAGEADDAYTGQFALNWYHPAEFTVARVRPAGTAEHPFDRLQVLFSQPIQDATFDLTDIQFAGPTGAAISPVAPPQQLTDQWYELNFTGLTSTDLYTLTIGPNVLSATGQLLNQDRDAFPGEPEDAYVGKLAGADLVIAADDTQYDGLNLVVSAATATIDGAHALQSLAVVNGGTVTHSAATVAAGHRMELDVADVVWIDALSSIDVSARGYVVDHTVGNTSSGGATGGSGASYGGLGLATRGGVPNSTYGDYRDPNELGSGGGGDGSIGGGSGGGLVRITADTAIVDGTIHADGEDGEYVWWEHRGGGGSGGGIRLDVGTLSGTGSITADGGGVGGSAGGGGGGGRIAVYYWDAMTLPSANLVANGGTSDFGPGEDGTIYVAQAGQELVPPFVLDQDPAHQVAGDVSQVRVRFSEDIVPGSFSTADVTLMLPSGVLVPEADLQVMQLAGDQYEIHFPTQTADGQYVLSIGPDISDLAGNVMRQAYQGEFTIEQSGPRVTAMLPAGQVLDVFSSIDLVFDSTLAAGSFLVDDVMLTAPDGSSIAITSIAQVAAMTYRLGFAEQVTPGAYTLVVGPGIADVEGKPMNQDGDVVNGEPADAFLAQLLLLLPDLTVAMANASAYGIAGQAIDVAWTVTNAGNSPAARNWLDKVYLSTDAEWDTGDLLLWTEDTGGFSPLVVGDQYQVLRTIAIPKTAPTGDLQLIFYADMGGAQAENDATNNTKTVPVAIKPIAPDVVIANAQEDEEGYVGYDVWNVDAAGQTKSQGVLDGQTATYLIKIQNATPATESYTVTSSSGSFGWTTAFFAAATGGSNISVQVLDNGWTTGPIASGDTKVIRAELTPSGLGIGSSTELLVQATAASDPVRSDFVGVAATVALDHLEIYDNDFETIAGAEWSSTTIDATPVGDRQFLGQFGQQTVTLSLAGLPDHSHVTLDFDLYVIRSWEGSGSSGPDAFDVTVDNGATLLHATLALVPGMTQSFPREYGGAAFPPRTGAEENNTLGYMHGDSPMDAVYHLTFTFPHVADDIDLRFSGLNLSVVTDESWGLDNVNVNVALQEEPPDLTFTDVFAPGSADWGQLIPVRWQVANQGINPARGRWSDEVYLSADEYLDAGDRLLLTWDASHVSPLASGDNYLADNQYVTVPTELAGDVYLLFLVDGSRTQVELDETNNVWARPITIRGPDLAVPLVTAPGAALTGQTISVSWRVENVGQSATTVAAWSDRVYLSTDDAVGDDVLLATFAHSDALIVGGSYGQVQSVQLDQALAAGQYWVVVRTDVFDQVPENDVAANVAISPAIQVDLAPVPDLWVSDVSGAPFAAVGQSYDVTWTVRNDSTAIAAASWTDEVYFSTDGMLTGATRLGSFVHGENLPELGLYTRTETVTLPDRADGPFYILVVTDSKQHVYERDGETNNVGTSFAKTLTHPDLMINQVAAPTAALSGDAISVSWRIRNGGTGPTANGWTDRVYLSSDTNLGGDVLLGELQHFAALLPTDPPIDCALVVTLPDGIEGDYHILAQTDGGGQVVEGPQGGENNNVAASGSLAIALAPFADLEVLLVTGQELLIGDPVDLTVAWKVTNVGTGQGHVDSWVDRVWLSRDETFGGNDLLVGEFPHSGFVPVGAEYQQTQIITLPPSTQDRFYLFVQTDATDLVYEHDDNGSNVADAGHPVDVMTIPYADLVVDEVAADSTGQNGQPISLSWTVSNIGIGATNDASWTDSVWLANDADGNGRVNLSGFSHVGALTANDSYIRSAQVTLPANVSGTKYLFVTTGGPFEFIYTGNNTNHSAPIQINYIPPPTFDLQVMTIDGPTTAVESQEVDVVWQVRNNGPDDLTGPWYDTVYLAPDGDMNRAITLGRFSRAQSLQAGHTYVRTEKLRLPAHAAGLYQFFVMTDSAREIGELNEANNLLAAWQPTTVTLLPRSDLQVTSMLAPQQVAAGGVIDVEFVVTNLGTAATPTGGSRWQDGIYVSLNNKLDGGDILLGSLPNGSALEVGESYRSTAAYQLPAAIGGNVYILAHTDSGNVVDEYPHDDNNTYAWPLAVDVAPVPPPELVVSNVAGPTDAFDGSTFTVHYRVSNLGAGVTYPAAWTDSIWLTLAKDRPNPQRGDILLGSFGHGGILDVGQSYERNVQVTLPVHRDFRGQYYVMVWTDAADAVYEHTFDVNINPDAPHDLDGNNYKAGNTINVFYTPPADLEVTAVNTPLVATGGDKVTLSWTVANNGTVPTERTSWADAIYVSADDKWDAGDQMVFGVPHVGTLQSEESYTQTATFTLPPSAEGQYFVVQTNVSPQLIRTEDDLFMEQLGQQVQGIVTRAEQKLGKPLTEVTNADLQSLSRADVFYVLLGDQTSNPTTVWEGPFTTNNTRAAACTVTNVPPDLTVANVQATPAAYSGESIDVSWTVTNTGAGPVWQGTRSWVDYVYLSPDATFIAARATLVAKVVHATPEPLAPGQSYSASARVTLPTGLEGRRYAHVFTDIGVYSSGSPILSPVDRGAFPNWPRHFLDRVWESSSQAASKQNNLGTSNRIDVTYRESDLQVTSLTVDPDQVNSGGLVDVAWTVANEGTRGTRVSTWLDRIYISTDPSLDLYDQLLGTYKHTGVVDVGASYSELQSVRLPDSIEGDFYLLMYIDSPFGSNPWGQPYPYPITQGAWRLSGGGAGMVQEFRDEGNDITAIPIHVTLVNSPDLQVTDVTPPEHATVGQGFSFQYTVQNLGGDTPERQSSWTDQFYLSRDDYLDVRSDHYLGSITHAGGLASQAEYTQTINAALPRGLIGAYHVIVLTDVPAAAHPWGQVYEAGREDNNAGASDVPMLIELPPPADLQIDQIVMPAAVMSGDEVTIQWTASNHSDQTITAYWDDAVYLSQDAVWDLGDRLIGRRTQGQVPDPTNSVPATLITLAPGAQYVTSLTAKLPSVLPGDYRVIVRADIYDDINEGAKNANNKTTSADVMHTDVLQLQLGTPLDDVIAGREERLYAVEVPAGETLEITLACDDDVAANELYARFEALPNSIHYDAIYAGNLWADQTAVVPNTHAGKYYILVRGTSGPADNPIQLTTRLLPFEITDVTPDTGGDDRFVHMAIYGARFDPSAVVKLIRPEFAEYEPVNYQVVDATTIKAFFDLRDAPHGLYDVQATNPDGAVARVPYRYLVETALPLDLTVGMGGKPQLPAGRYLSGRSARPHTGPAGGIHGRV